MVLPARVSSRGAIGTLVMAGGCPSGLRTVNFCSAAWDGSTARIVSNHKPVRNQLCCLFIHIPPHNLKQTRPFMTDRATILLSTFQLFTFYCSYPNGCLRTIVSFRSGPVEIISMGISVMTLIRSRYLRAFVGNSW